MSSEDYVLIGPTSPPSNIGPSGPKSEEKASITGAKGALMIHSQEEIDIPNVILCDLKLVEELKRDILLQYIPGDVIDMISQAIGKYHIIGRSITFHPLR